MLKVKQSQNEFQIIDSVVDSLNIYKYDAIEINEKVLYVPIVILEVIDSLHQQLEEAHTGHGISQD